MYMKYNDRITIISENKKFNIYKGASNLFCIIIIIIFIIIIYLFETIEINSVSFPSAYNYKNIYL